MTTLTHTIALPESCTLPTGYRWGAHIVDSRWWLLRTADNAAIEVDCRPDLVELDEDAAPGSMDDTHGMTADDILEAIEEAFAPEEDEDAEGQPCGVRGLLPRVP